MNSDQSSPATVSDISTESINAVPKEVSEILLLKTTMKIETEAVKGYDFNTGIDYPQLIKSYATTGFQSTCTAKAIELVNKMLHWRLSDEPYNPANEHDISDMEIRKKTKCSIFLGYTSNMVSSGMREIIRFLVEHKLVDCIVTTCGGIEEDFIKCMAPTYLGDFHADDIKLRQQGVNRTANLLMPNDNYTLFEDWVLPLFDEMYDEQKSKGTIWSPRKIIKRLGEKINNPESIYYWAAKNDIPVFCPAFTDGSMGDMLFMHSYKRKGFICDLVKDIKKLNKLTLNTRKSGAVILGGGVVKHHILNSNILKGGVDYCVYINTGNEWDGSDAGARPHEALSWGKIKIDGEFVKVWTEATLVFPLIVAESFAKYYHEVQRVEEQRAKVAVREENESVKKEEGSGTISN